MRGSGPKQRSITRAEEAYAAYVAMGEQRTLRKLAAQLQPTWPTPSSLLVIKRGLERWSSHFGWQARIAAITTAQVVAAETAEGDRIAAILTTGYALQHERVAILKELTETLVEELQTGRLWLTEKKSLITGHTLVTGDDGRIVGREADYEVYEQERPNSAWVEQVRGLLKDIAEEVGGRIKQSKSELTGAGGGAIIIERVDYGSGNPV